MSGQEGTPVEVLAAMTGAAVANTAYDKFPPDARTNTHGYRTGIAGAAFLALAEEVQQWPDGDSRLIVARQYAEAIIALTQRPQGTR